MTYNFATAFSETITLNLKTLTTKLLLVSKPQNCELKQEPRTLATELHQPLKFHNRENKYFSTFAKLGWNCSEIATSGRIFVLTLNRASALRVPDNIQVFLLRQLIVSNEGRIGLESKLRYRKIVS